MEQAQRAPEGRPLTVPEDIFDFFFYERWNIFLFNNEFFQSPFGWWKLEASRRSNVDVDENRRKCDDGNWEVHVKLNLADFRVIAIFGADDSERHS